MVNSFQLLVELERYFRLHSSCSALWKPSDCVQPSGSQVSAHSLSSPVVVSLTTIPDRIHLILPTLRSLFTQTVSPSAIYLNIPYYSRRQGRSYTIPEKLKGFRQVKIIRTEQDWGPATKFLPLLEKLPPDSRVIVVDDDQIYSRRLVETYVRYSHQYPDAALGLAGWLVPERFCHTQRKPIEGARTRLLDRPPNVCKRPKSVDILQGASSYLIRPRFLTNAVFQYQDAPLAAFFADDVWISGHLARNRVLRLVIPGDFQYARILSLLMLKTLSLSSAENHDGRNNQILYEFFQKDWKTRL